MADYTLAVNVKAIDQASKVFKTIQGNVDTFKKDLEGASGSVTTLGDSMQQTGRNMTSAGKMLTATVTAPIAGVAVAASKTAIGFDQQMSRVKAISGATGDEFEKLREQAIQLGADSVFGATEAAQGMENMASAGFTVNEIMAAMPGMLNLAASSGEDLASSADIAASAVRGFGLEASQTAHVADVLAKNAADTNAAVADTGEALKYVAPVAASCGLSLEEVTASIGIMANAGIQGSQAGTTLRGALTRMMKPTEAMTVQMDKLGVSFYDSDGKMKSLNTIIGEMKTGMQGLTEAEQQQALATIFGTNAVSGMMALVNAAPGELENMTKGLQNCDGAAQEMADTMMDNTAGSIEEMNGAIETAAIKIGDVLTPYITKGANAVASLVDKFNQLSPGTQDMIVKAALLAAAAGPVLAIGGKLVSGFGTLLNVGSQVSGMIGGLGSAAGSAAGPVASAGSSVGTLSSNALGLVAAGAGILLASAGLALLAQSAIAIADAGPGAAVALVGLVAALALMTAGAAALAPALTAGAVGLVAFGAALALVGVGVLAASAGMTLLATQLPTISQYGSTAAVNITQLGGAMAVYAAGATVAGAGSLVLAAGLTVLAASLLAAGAGATVAAAGIVLLSGGVIVLSGGVLLLSAGVLALGAALVACGSGLTTIAGTSNTAALGFTALTVACTAAFVPIVGGAASTLALDAALIGLVATLALSAAGAVALDVAMLALVAELKVIASSSKSSAKDLQSMVTAVDVVETGLKSLKNTAQQAIDGFVNAFSSGKATAQSTATQFSNAVTKAIDNGMKPIPNNTKSTLALMNTAVTTGFTKMNTKISTEMDTAKKKVKSSIQEMESAFRNAKFNFNQHIALPHFSMSGSFNAQTGATPTVHVQWYRKAYDAAMMFNTPTVIGATGMGFGDGNGAEIVTGDQHLIDLMRDAFGDGIGGNIIIPVYVGQDRIDELVVTAQQRNNFRSGGR